MQESKVVRQITAMDGRERERLRQFVNSPYFNRHAATATLLDFVLKELGRSKPRLTEERAQAALANTKSGQSLADLQSGLMKLINKFLAIEQLQQEPFREEVLTVKRTKALHRERLLDNRGKRLDNKIARHHFRDAATHLAAYEWKNINGYRQVNKKRTDTREMQAMLNHLDRFYLVEKLRHACQLTANMMMMATHYDLIFLEPILEYLDGEAGRELLKSGKEPSIDAYYHTLMTMRDPEDATHYQRITYYLEDGVEKLPENHRRDIYGFASNYCITRVMSGHANYRTELLDLYRRGLTTGLIYEQGEISEFDYKNIVTIAAANGEFDWTERFMEENRDRLPADRRENAYALNKANYLYRRGKLKEAAQLLVTVTDSDVVYHLARVLLEVRIAYDQSDSDYALGLLETFRLYVTRSRRINTKDKKSYNNYVRYTKQLVSLKALRGFTDKESYARKLSSLRSGVEKADQIKEKAWLLQELEAIK